MKKQNKKRALCLVDVYDSLICQAEAKVIFENELVVGKVRVPVKTELDFSNVSESQHEKILEFALQIYYKDRQIM